MKIVCITKCRYVGELIGGVLAQCDIEYQCFTDSNDAMQSLIKKEHDYLILEDHIQPVDCLTICKVNAAVLGDENRTIIISSNREKSFLVKCINAGATKIIAADGFNLESFVGLFGKEAESITQRLPQCVESARGLTETPTEEIREHTSVVVRADDTADEDGENCARDILAQIKGMKASERALSGDDYCPIDYCPIAKIDPEDPYLNLAHFDEVFGSIEPITEQVIAAAKSEDIHLRDISKIIGRDPYLSAMILKQANLRKQGAGRVHSLGEACVVLGVAAIERITISSAILKLFKDPVCETPISFIQKLITRSAIASVVAEQVCGLMKMSQRSTSRICQAALMSDIGRIALYESQPVHYAELLDYIETTGVCPEQIESTIIGRHHRFYSMLIAKHWGLEPEVCALINASRRAHDKSRQVDSKEAYCLMLARDIMSSALPVGLFSDSFYEHGVDLTKAGVSPDGIATLYERLPEISNVTWSCLFGEASLPDWVMATDSFNQSRLSFSGPAQSANMLRWFTDAWNTRSAKQAVERYDILDLRYSPPSLANKVIAQQRVKQSDGTIVVLRHSKLLAGVVDQIEANASVQVVQEPLSWRKTQLAIERIKASKGKRRPHAHSLGIGAGLPG